MLGIPSAIFWSSVGIVAYTYAGYPLLIRALSMLHPKQVKKKKIEPNITIVLPAYNEERHIEKKIINLLSLDYPKDKVQIIIVSDGSTDETDNIVKKYSDRNVALERLRNPFGKPSAINHGVSKATAEIIVFCDARQRIHPGAVKELVSNFADPSVGAVSGELIIEGNHGPGFYWKYEKFIRSAEANFDSIPGATGALFAIRHKLFRDIPEESLLDDVFTPMQIALQGYRVILEPNALVYDSETELSAEFSRKVRTITGNFQLLEHLPAVVNPLKNRLFFQIVSHKLMRLVCPAALISLLGSNIVLIALPTPGWPIYAFILAGQLILYGAALNSIISKKETTRLSTLAKTFVVLNVAAMEGARRYISRNFTW